MPSPLMLTSAHQLSNWPLHSRLPHLLFPASGERPEPSCFGWRVTPPPREDPREGKERWWALRYVPWRGGWVGEGLKANSLIQSFRNFFSKVRVCHLWLGAGIAQEWSPAADKCTASYLACVSGFPENAAMSASPAPAIADVVLIVAI